MIVETKQGQLEGIEKLGCLQFRGIPFAAPPVGDLRWKSPRPHQGWDGVRDASQFGPICPQVSGTLERLGGASGRPAQPMSEDCLTLNVYTPALDDEQRPVMVWIHGGAFSTGSGRIPWYSGHNFARDGIVVVTINYRVSAFGFLHLEDQFGSEFRDSGTAGTQDQIAALQWVRDNIASFGGDPDNVTIFGESAGGMSVGTLVAAPAAKGLFHKAIPQSGASHASHARETANLITEKFCEFVGVTSGDVDALLSLSTDDIVDGVEKIGLAITNEDAALFGPDHCGFSMPFQPVHGGDVLPKFPLDAVKDGSASDVPTLVGTNLEEWKLFALGLKEDALRTHAVRPLRNLCTRAGRSADDIVAAYQQHVGTDSEYDLRVAMETDRNFLIPAIRLAEAQATSGAPTWMYRFDWKSPAFGGKMGSAHALEIPFVFDNLDAPGAGVFTGDAAPPELATKMHAAWVAFAKTGDPNIGDLPDWPRYDTKTRPTMLLDAECAVENDPNGDLRELWDGVL
jgi:para-nitrobenzyl esterase